MMTRLRLALTLALTVLAKTSCKEAQKQPVPSWRHGSWD